MYLLVVANEGLNSRVVTIQITNLLHIDLLMATVKHILEAPELIGAKACALVFIHAIQ